MLFVHSGTDGQPWLLHGLGMQRHAGEQAHDAPVPFTCMPLASRSAEPELGGWAASVVRAELRRCRSRHAAALASCSTAR